MPTPPTASTSPNPADAAGETDAAPANPLAALSAMIDRLTTVPLRWLNRATGDLVYHTGAMVEFGWQALRSSVIGLLAMLRLTRFKAFHPSHIIIQMETAGVQSFSIIALVAFLVGLTLVLQTVLVLDRWGQKEMVSGVVAVTMARELGPLITAIVFAGRVGAAYTAELGTMKVQEEILALETMGINPIAYLVAPRFLAAVVMLPCLSLLSLFVGLMGGYFIGITVFDIPSNNYLDWTKWFLAEKDLFYGMSKSLVFGFLIIIIHCHKGFSVEGGGEEVGRATMEAVVISLVAIIFSDMLMGMVFNLLKLNALY